MSSISGVLTRLTVYRGRWGRGLFTTDSGESLACVGEALICLKKGSHYQLSGSIKLHDTYGEQFEVTTVQAQSSTARAPAKKAKRAAAARSRSVSSGTGAASGRKWPRRAAPSRAANRESLGPTTQAGRIAAAAYGFGCELIDRFGDVPALTAAITERLCETMAWAAIVDTCRDAAHLVATELVSGGGVVLQPTEEVEDTRPFAQRVEYGQVVPRSRKAATRTTTTRTTSVSKTPSFGTAYRLQERLDGDIRKSKDDIDLIMLYEIGYHVARDLASKKRSVDQIEAGVLEVFARMESQSQDEATCREVARYSAHAARSATSH